MNLSAIWVKRPVMTVLVMLSILFFGIICYRNLPVSDLPSIDFPVIVVSAAYPGASPEVTAAMVATPLEKQFSIIPGLEAMTSMSQQGFTQIVLQFALEKNMTARRTTSMPPSTPPRANCRKTCPARRLT